MLKIRKEDKRKSWLKKTKTTRTVRKQENAPEMEIQLEAALSRRRQLRISDFMSGVSSP